MTRASTATNIRTESLKDAGSTAANYTSNNTGHIPGHIPGHLSETWSEDSAVRYSRP